MKLLAFDTETTGLPPKNGSIEWPYIVQFSWMLYDTDTHKYTPYDYVIQCPIQIPEESTNIHKITQGVSKQQGYDFTDVLSIFMECEKQCDLVIAHNYKFDNEMILVECKRRNLSFSFTKPWYCTMVYNRHLNHGKWPKLVWLHQLFFQEEPQNLHNSMIDVIVCVRCYMKTMYDIDICNKVKGLKRLGFIV